MTAEMYSSGANGNRRLLLSKTEEDLYEMAYSEVRGDSRRQGLWAKTLSESLGDEQKAEALYLRYRVEQLSREQLAQKQEKETESRMAGQQWRSEIIPFICPHCGGMRSVTKGQISDRVATKPPAYTFSCGACGKVFDVRDVIPEELRYTLPELRCPNIKVQPSIATQPHSAVATIASPSLPTAKRLMHDPMTLYNKYARNGETILVKQGFSWPGLFCGAFHLWYRGMTAQGFMWLAFAPCTLGVSWLVYPFLANEIYAKYLVNTGWSKLPSCFSK